MPGMCSVPGCKARSRGVVFHSLPTRDPQRCRKWLQAIKGPRFDENTPTSKYGNIRVCSQHFKPEDYEPDIQAEFMKTTLWKILKSKVIPTVFSGRQHEDRVPLHLHRRLPWVSKVLLWMLHRLLPPCQLLYDRRSSILMTSTGTSMQETTALSRLECVSSSERGKQHQQDDVEDQSESRYRASEVDGLQDSFEEMEVTIDYDECNSVKNRRYKTSELKLECEEVELEPWQIHTLRVHFKEESDVGELNVDQTDCKPDPSSLQSCAAGRLTLTPEDCAVVHTAEGHQISNSPVSLSSVQSPEVSSNKLQSDQSNSQTLSAPFSALCFTVIKFDTTET